MLLPYSISRAPKISLHSYTCLRAEGSASRSPRSGRREPRPPRLRARPEPRGGSPHVLFLPEAVGGRQQPLGIQQGAAAGVVPPVVMVSDVLEADDPGPGRVPGRLAAHDARAALCGLPELPPAEGSAEKTGRGADREAAGEGGGRGGASSWVWRVWSQVQKGERSRGPWKGGTQTGGAGRHGPEPAGRILGP